jgi:hypothetical protein
MQHVAVPWLRRLVTGLSPHRPGFDPGSVHVGFLVDKVALGQVFPRVLPFPPCQLHSLRGNTKKTDHLSLHLHSKGCTISFKAAVRP